MSIGDPKKRAAGTRGDVDPPPKGDADPPPKVDAGPVLDGPRTGRVKFDARGNAIWEWAVATGAFGRDVSTERLKTLENHSLSLADDSSAEAARPGAPGGVKGYNPYDNGKPRGSAAAAAKKTDLRKLGEWLKLKKQAAENKDKE